MFQALHFVGFKNPPCVKDERYWRAVRVFGTPNFIHRGWDYRAQREIADGDIVVFATGDETQEPKIHSYDDSANV